MQQKKNEQRNQSGRPARTTPVINVESKSTKDQLTKGSSDSAGYDVTYTGPDVVLQKGVVNSLSTGLFLAFIHFCQYQVQI